MDLEHAGRRRAATRAEPWHVLKPDHSWDELVLPELELELLRSVPAELSQRQADFSSWEATRALGTREDGPVPGLRLLFAGDLGTGKTMAARILGAELGQTILHVDLVSLLPDDHDQAEQLVARLFDVARSSDAIVLLNSVRGWVGRHARAQRPHERRIAFVASGLLDQTARYPGLLIVASNRKRRIDEAPVEHFDYAIDFPLPEAEGRGKLWRSGLPHDVQMSESDLDYLSASFKLSGGAIHDCCARAAAGARREGVPLGMVHIALAVEEQFHGRLVSERTREALAHLRSIAGLPPDPSVAAEPELAAPSAARSELAPPAATRPRSPDVRSRALKPRVAPVPGRRSWVLALSGTLAAAVLGYLAAQSTGGRAASAPAEKHASTGFFEVSFPSGWTRSFAPLPQLGLTDALALERAAPAGGRLVLGRTRTTDASLLPAALLAKLPAAPTAQVVRLGANTFYRYPNLSPRGLGASASLYALPATTGTILGACVTPRASPAFTSRCEALLATMRLASGTGLAQPPSPRYAAALSAAIARLNTTRRNAGRRLRSARTAPAQAKAAAELAVAHSRAAAALAPLSPGPVASGANAAVARALKEAGDAYRALARAAARGDRQAYRTATAELTRAAGALNQAYSQLSRLGYRIG